MALVDIIIMSEHRQGEALSKTTWTDEEEEFVSVFHLLDKSRFVNIVAVILADIHEVHHAVRYTAGLHSCQCLFHISVK